MGNDSFFETDALPGGDGPAFDPESAGTPTAVGPAPAATAAPQLKRSNPAPPQPITVKRPSAAQQAEQQILHKVLNTVDEEDRKRARRADAPIRIELVDPDLLAEEAGERREAVATWLLILLLTLAAALAWVAVRNEGVLDFSRPHAMLAIALGQPVEQPSELGAIDHRGGPSTPTPPEARTPEALAIRDERAVVVRPADDRSLLLLEGFVRNNDEVAWRRIEVRVRMVAPDGRTLLERTLPAGGTLSLPELHAIRGDQSIEVAFQDLRRRTADLAVQPGQQTRFAAVFLPPDGISPSRLRWETEIIQGEALVLPACWIGSAQDPSAEVEETGAPPVEREDEDGGE